MNTIVVQTRISEDAWRLLSARAAHGHLSLAAYLRKILEHDSAVAEDRDSLRNDIRALSIIAEKMYDHSTTASISSPSNVLHRINTELLLLLRAVVQPAHLDVAHREMRQLGLAPWSPEEDTHD